MTDMIARDLEDMTRNPVRVGFAFFLTVLTLFTCVFLCAVGFWSVVFLLELL